MNGDKLHIVYCIQNSARPKNQEWESYFNSVICYGYNNVIRVSRYESNVI